MNTCVNQIAASVGLNCDNPIIGGYTGRAILIPIEVIGNGVTFVTSQDPREARAIGVSIAQGTGRVLAGVDNAMMTTPFDGSQTTASDDDGFRKFVKAFAFRIPERGGDIASAIIEPLARGGRYVAILEKKQRVGDGGYEVLGYRHNLRCVDPSTIVRQETANGGAWGATLQCAEREAEFVFAGDLTDVDNYSATRAAFEALWSNNTMNV